MTAWEQVPAEVRADIRQAAIQQLTLRLDRIDYAISVAGEARVDDQEIDDLAERRNRLQRALEAAERLP